MQRIGYVTKYRGLDIQRSNNLVQTAIIVLIYKSIQSKDNINLI